MHSFLTNRTQTVIVNGEKSDPAPVLSGVPQGSVIGPLLFLVLIGIIDKDVYNSFLSMALIPPKMPNSYKTI